MDIVLFASLTTSLTFLAKEVAKGFANESGKSLWNKVSNKLFPSKNVDPNSDDLAAKIALVLKDNPKLVNELADEIKSSSIGTSASIIQQAEKIINIDKQDIQGDFTINM